MVLVEKEFLSLFFQFERPPPGFTFATVASSNFETFFIENANPSFRRIGQNMKQHGVDSVSDGVVKVHNG